MRRGGSSGRRQRCRRRQVGGAGGLVLLGGGAGGWRCCCEVWQGWQAVGAVQVVQGWRWCVVIVGGGLLLAWSSGAALAVLILPGAGGGRCGLLRLRCAGVVIVATPTTPSACRAAYPAGREGGKAGRQGKRKRPGRRRVVRCCSGLLSALAVRSAAPGASRCISWAVAVCSPFRCRAAGAGTDPGATVPAGNVPAWHGLRWRCSIRCVFAVCRRGQILHFTG